MNTQHEGRQSTCIDTLQKTTDGALATTQADRQAAKLMKHQLLQLEILSALKLAMDITKETNKQANVCQTQHHRRLMRHAGGAAWASV